MKNKILLIALLLSVCGVYLINNSSKANALSTKYGEVTQLFDGDTFEIDWEGSDHTAGLNVRIAGVDTNETAPSVPVDECYSQQATTRLSQLIPVGTRIKFVAKSLSSSSQGRALGHVFYGPGYSSNVAVTMIAGGYGLPASYSNEPDYKTNYFTAGEQAQKDGVGMWAAGACGGSPGSWPSLETYVNYDADGDDTKNVNGEFIEIRNTGSVAQNIGSWTLRSSARLNGQTHTLPSGRTIQPNAVHRIYMGSGTNTSTKTYLGLSSPWLNNSGDVIYIRDTDLNVRIAKFWPCTVSCEAKKSIVVEDVRYDATGDDSKNPNGEWIRLRNLGNTTVNLRNYTVRDNSKVYRFTSDTYAAPGKRFILYVGKGSSTYSKKHWGNSKGILSNSGNDYVQVLSPDSVEIDCYTWGSTDNCGNEHVRGAIRMYANFNASGNDIKNPNGEWIMFDNVSRKTFDLSGYKVYTPGSTYTFPSGTKISGGKYLRLRIGKGINNTYNKYWGKSSGILNNGGDYVQLRSSSNSVIFEHKWPCPISCGYSHGLVIDRVNYNAPGDDSKNPNGEWIRIKNTSTAVQDLQSWKIKVGPYQLVSVASRPMDPGETITIYMGKGKSTSSKMHWGKTKGILLNSGSRTVDLYSPLRHHAKCASWGSGSC